MSARQRNAEPRLTPHSTLSHQYNALKDRACDDPRILDPRRLHEAMGRRPRRLRLRYRDRVRGAETGFECYFVKPVGVNDIVSVLEERVIEPLFAGAR